MAKSGRLYIPLDVSFVDEYAHLSSDAIRLFTELLSFAKRVGTDGYFTALHVRRATAINDPKDALRELFDAGLIEAEAERNGVCFEVFIPSYAGWNDEANAKQKAGQKGGIASGVARRAAKQLEAPFEAKPKQVLEQVEKRREEKNKGASPSAQLSDPILAEFAEIWDLVPKRDTDGRGTTLKAYRARRNDGVSHEALKRAALNYAKDPERLAKPEYTMGSAKFFGAGEHWVRFAEASEKRELTPHELNAITQDMRRQQEEFLAAALAAEAQGA